MWRVWCLVVFLWLYLLGMWFPVRFGCWLVFCVLWCVVTVGLHKFRCVGGVGGFLLFWSCCGIVPGFRLSWLGCDGILGFPVGLVVYLWVLWFWWFCGVLRVFSVLLDC